MSSSLTPAFGLNLSYPILFMKTMRSSSHGRAPGPSCRGFTLVELLTVIAIVGVLAAILIPVVGHARARADESVCLARFRQIGTLITLYMADHRGVLPGPLADGRVCGWYAKNTAYERGTLAGRLQPYLGGPEPTNAGRHYPEVFKCPTVAKNPLPNKTAADDGAIITKVVNVAVALDGTASGPTTNPFGVGNDDTAAGGASGTSRPLAYPALSGVNLGRTFAIRECSEDNTAYTPASTYVPHGRALNVLFFDWHVGRLDAATLDPL